MKRFPIKVILLSLFIVINLTVICTFPTSMSDNDSEEVVNNLVTFLNKNDITVSPTIIDKVQRKFLLPHCKILLKTEMLLQKIF